MYLLLIVSPKLPAETSAIETVDPVSAVRRAASAANPLNVPPKACGMKASTQAEITM